MCVWGGGGYCSLPSLPIILQAAAVSVALPLGHVRCSRKMFNLRKCVKISCFESATSKHQLKINKTNTTERLRTLRDETAVLAYRSEEHIRPKHAAANSKLFCSKQILFFLARGNKYLILSNHGLTTCLQDALRDQSLARCPDQLTVSSFTQKLMCKTHKTNKKKKGNNPPARCHCDQIKVNASVFSPSCRPAQFWECASASSHPCRSRPLQLRQPLQQVQLLGLQLLPLLGLLPLAGVQLLQVLRCSRQDRHLRCLGAIRQARDLVP